MLCFSLSKGSSLYYLFLLWVFHWNVIKHMRVIINHFWWLRFNIMWIYYSFTQTRHLSGDVIWTANCLCRYQHIFSWNYTRTGYCFSAGIFSTSFMINKNLTNGSYTRSSLLSGKTNFNIFNILYHKTRYSNVVNYSKQNQQIFY